jgi:hypothetical protein
MILEIARMSAEICRLPAALLQLLYHAFKIRIAGAKAPRNEVAAALGHGLSIGDDFKLSCLPRSNYRVNPKPLLDEVCETRDLGFIVPSCRAGAYFNLHLDSPTAEYLSLILEQLGLRR